MIRSTALEWERVLRGSVKDGKIKKAYLLKIPVLKNCTNWKDIEVIGSIDYQGKAAHYDGVIVLLKGKIYFVNRKTLDALQEFLKIRNIPPIKVI